MKILVFTTDVIPLPGFATSGTALRTWGLAQGLKSLGHEVVISVPKTGLRGLQKTLDISSLEANSRRQLEDLQTLAFDSQNQSDLVQQIQPDAIVCGHWPAMAMAVRPSQPVIIDLAGPHLLERHYQGSSNQAGAVLGKLNAIAHADGYIVSGPTQRLYFLSFMLRAQIPGIERRIVTIPMPLDPNVPQRTKTTPFADSPRFVFGGVFLPWQDPSTALRQTAAAIERKKKGQLTLIGGSHPSYKIKGGVYESLFAELNKNSRVQTKPMLPYDRFISELAECDVAVDLMAWNLERELAMTIRSTTYLWAGLPVIYNDYADLGKIIDQYDAGWCVSPRSPEALDNVLDEVFNDPSVILRKSANASRLAREVFSWNTAVVPLLDMLGSRREESLRETDILFDFPDNANLSIDANHAIEQYFVCRLNGLSRLECRFATHNRSISDPIQMSLYELDSSVEKCRQVGPHTSRRLVQTQTSSPEQIKNNEWHAFDIEPISDSGGKLFAVRIESQSQDGNTSVSPWAVRGSPFPLLKLYRGGSALAETAISFRTTCTNGN